jgi:hypothetical protein
MNIIIEHIIHIRPIGDLFYMIQEAYGIYTLCILQLSLSYFALCKKVRIPWWYFLLYAIACIIHIITANMTLATLNKNKKYQTKFASFQNPTFVSCTLVSIVFFITAFYLLWK